jgi:hypothetical protein
MLHDAPCMVFKRMCGDVELLLCLEKRVSIPRDEDPSVRSMSV